MTDKSAMLKLALADFEDWYATTDACHQIPYEAARMAWAAALAKREAVEVPEGFVIVPVEPTQEMIERSRWANDCFPNFAGHEKLNIDIYRAMLAASQQAAKGEVT